MIIFKSKWNTLIKFIKKNREKGKSSFKIVTTSNELIIYAEERDDKESIRIKY